VSFINEPVPQAARVLLRVEWADGQVREFDATQPRDLDVSIGREDPPMDFEAWAEALGEPGRQWMPERPLYPAAIYAGEAHSVAVTFKANRDSYRHPFTIRDTAGESDPYRDALDDIREGIGNFLAAYGDSELPMFKVGQDLANAILKRIPECPDVADMVHEILEAVCMRDGLSLESTVDPGEPARNYELALRLGIGHVFGVSPE
jgi:hypothetical protein